jgi:hypothetical protein
MPNFQISGDETLDIKPIIYVRIRVKTRLRQCIIPKFSAGGPPEPGPREGKGGREEWKREERLGGGRGGRNGRGGREGLKEREGKRS